MTCEKCGYKDKKEVKIFETSLCRVCATFSPKNNKMFEKYISEKLDWKSLETFRKYNQSPGERQKQGMNNKAKIGKIVTRAPFGYDVIEGNLVPNEDSARLHSLFKTFLNRPYSLNSLAKNFSLSVNGLKKILTNRTYLGEIKFAGNLYKGTHKPLVSAEIFYATQRKLNEILRSKQS